jgi:hypothetical protein
MTSERWRTIPKREQLLHIGAEFERGRVAEEEHDPDRVRFMLERALALIDLTLGDPKWREETRMLLGLRDEVAKSYLGESKSPVERLYQLL